MHSQSLIIHCIKFIHYHQFKNENSKLAEEKYTEVHKKKKIPLFILTIFILQKPLNIYNKMCHQ